MSTCIDRDELTGIDLIDRHLSYVEQSSHLFNSLYDAMMRPTRAQAFDPNTLMSLQLAFYNFCWMLPRIAAHDVGICVMPAPSCIVNFNGTQVTLTAMSYRLSERVDDVYADWHKIAAIAATELIDFARCMRDRMMAESVLLGIYVPIIITPTIYNAVNFTPQHGLMSRYSIYTPPSKQLELDLRAYHQEV